MSIDLLDSDNKHSHNPNNNTNPNDPAEIARRKRQQGIPLTPDEMQLLVKDRQRKDNHNLSKTFLTISSTTLLQSLFL